MLLEKRIKRVFTQPVNAASQSSAHANAPMAPLQLVAIASTIPSHNLSFSQGF